VRRRPIASSLVLSLIYSHSPTLLLCSSWIWISVLIYLLKSKLALSHLMIFQDEVKTFMLAKLTPRPHPRLCLEWITYTWCFGPSGLSSHTPHTCNKILISEVSFYVDKFYSDQIWKMTNFCLRFYKWKRTQMSCVVTLANNHHTHVRPFFIILLFESSGKFIALLHSFFFG
jgi:hypothetical protein